MTTTSDVFEDPTLEWQLLNKLMLPENVEYVNRLTPNLFTGKRTEVHRAMQLAFIDYGTISYEALSIHMKGKVPGELTAATRGDFYAILDHVIRLARKRQLRDHAETMKKLAAEYNPDLIDIQAATEFEPITADKDSTLTIGAQEFIGNIHGKKNGDYIFRRTGFKTMDRTMGGEYRPASLVVLLGAAGSGKTALWLNSAKAMAKGFMSNNEQIPITPSLFFSLEMTKADLILRMVADELEIDNTDLSSAEFDKIIGTDEDQRWDTVDDLITAIEDKVAELQTLPMFVIEDESLTLAEIIYQIRKHVHKKHVKVVGLDYLQLINHSPTGNANADLGDVAKQLKAVAKREGITIVLFSQLNRSKEGMDAIRDSGEVQAVASVIVQVMSEDDDETGIPTPIRSASLAWWKNRHGKAGHKTPLLFHGPWQRFYEGELNRHAI